MIGPYDICRRIFLAYAAYMGSMVYQMDVKSAFLNALYGLNKLQKHADSASVKCHMLPPNNLGLDESGVSVNETLFRGMIGPLIYLTASRLDIQFSICLCARLSMLLLLDVMLKSSRSKFSWRTTMFSMTRYYSSETHCKYTKNFVPLPQKETVKAALATPGLVDENDPELSLTNLEICDDQLNINQQIIASSLCWGLDIDIASIVFSDLVARLITGKKGRDLNIDNIKLCPIFTRKTYSSSSNNSFGLVPIASPTLSLFHDDPYMKVMHAYYAKESPIPPPTIMPPSSMFNPQEFFLPEELLPIKKRGHDRSSSSTFSLPQEFEMGESSHFNNLEAELQKARAQIAKLQMKQLGNNNKIALTRFKIANLEQIIEEIQVRHKADKESLLNAIYELKNSQEGPSDY
ncbi:hypothetical protein Tco_0992225 [Tanacetum coccineum]|uniref:Reverse transcriptase Ty1/copia-type domain-containing protein n=1 Tax=Tanacetum coccineum TaxID=301880 RepID=A0ABQ5F1F8_9ASTR